MPGLDEWSCSLILAGEVASPTLEADAAEFKVPIKAWFDRTASAINSGVTLEYVKFNQINKSDGKYTSTSASDTFILSPVSTSPLAQAARVPNQNTQAITLHSDLARGRGSKGRFYPPTTSHNGSTMKMDADGRMDLVFTKALADSAEQLLNDINALAVNLSVVVWSQVGQSAHGVEKVSCGRVVDTQRRRRNSLEEDRQFATDPIVGPGGP